MTRSSKAVQGTKQHKAAQLGRESEALAASYLHNKGFCILERNWRQGRHELDIICRDGDTLVFVEVRARQADGMLHPLETLTPKKLRSFVLAAQVYLAATQQWDSPCRCDIVCVLAHSKAPCPPSSWLARFWASIHEAAPQPHIEHHTHVIELSETLGSGNASW